MTQSSFFPDLHTLHTTFSYFLLLQHKGLSFSEMLAVDGVSKTGLAFPLLLDVTHLQTGPEPARDAEQQRNGDRTCLFRSIPVPPARQEVRNRSFLHAGEQRRRHGNSARDRRPCGIAWRQSYPGPETTPVMGMPEQEVGSRAIWLRGECRALVWNWGLHQQCV
jgi:hypothetical protein